MHPPTMSRTPVVESSLSTTAIPCLFPNFAEMAADLLFFRVAVTEPWPMGSPLTKIVALGSFATILIVCLLGDSKEHAAMGNSRTDAVRDWIILFMV